MSCNCNKATNTGSCIANFTVGVATATTSYNVYFKTPTGRTDIYPVTSDSAGNIIVDAPRVRIGDNYQLWINIPGDPADKQLSFTIGDTAVNCVNIEFTECFEDDEYLAPIDQTLTLTM